MRLRPRLLSLFTAIAAAGLAGLGGVPASAQTVVDCTAGETIGDAINNGSNFISFSGTCSETVFINRDEIFIEGSSGDPTQDVINGAVQINGESGIDLEHLTVRSFVNMQGGGSVRFFDTILTGGLFVFDSSHAEVFNSQINGAGDISIFGNSNLVVADTIIDDLRGGLFITNGSMAQFDRSPITNTDNGTFVARNGTLRFRFAFMGPALVDDPDLSCNAICIVDGAVVRLDGAVVEGSTDEPGIGGAILASRNGTLLLRGDVSVTNTGSQPALAVVNASSARQDLSGAAAPSTITGGLLVAGQSFTDIRAAAVNGEVNVQQHSVLRLGSTGFGGDPAGTSITGATTISQDSALVAEDPAVTINGSITCLDKQSSLSGPFGGSGKITKCRDFDNNRIRR